MAEKTVSDYVSHYKSLTTGGGYNKFIDKKKSKTPVKRKTKSNYPKVKRRVTKKYLKKKRGKKRKN